MGVRPVVVGILNRTRDSFHDGGAYVGLDRLLNQAERLVADGADVLEVGARPGGVGVIEVPAEQECHLAAGTIAELHARFDLRYHLMTVSAAMVVRADAAELLAGLPTGCVDAVVTDPPLAGTGRQVAARLSWHREPGSTEARPQERAVSAAAGVSPPSRSPSVSR